MLARRVLCVLLGACTVIAALSLPALAAPQSDLNVQITSAELTLTAGEEGGKISVTVNNKGPDAVKPYLIISIPFVHDGVKAQNASGACRRLGADVRCPLPSLSAGSSRAISVTVSSAPSDAVSTEKTENITATVLPDPSSKNEESNSEDNTATQVATLKPEPAPITEISGYVRDTSEQNIADAEVTLRDEMGHEHTLHTDEVGLFLYNPGRERSNALQRGEITISVRADGYNDTTQKTVTVGRDPVAGVTLVLPAPDEGGTDALPSSSNNLLAEDEGTATEKQKLSGAEVLIYGTAIILALMTVFALIMYVRHRAELRRARQ